MPYIVQFFHPGTEHEYDKRIEGNKFIKEWNNGNHKRKFILNSGKYIKRDSDGPQKGGLLFWGEWEPTSEVEELPGHSPVLPHEVYPKYLHRPIIPGREKIISAQNKGSQNTDPFVFGDTFKYSICMQDANEKLKNLEPGSLILFGSCVKRRFAIDTVFVVGKAKKYNSPSDITKGDIDNSDLYRGIVLEMNCGEKLSGDAKKWRTLYIGATYDNPVNGMYSFVPAIEHDGKRKCFSRIVMPDDFYSNENKKINQYFSSFLIQKDKIFEGKNQGVKITDTPIDKVKYFWEYIKNYTLKDHVLGINFEIPSLRA